MRPLRAVLWSISKPPGILGVGPQAHFGDGQLEIVGNGGGFVESDRFDLSSGVAGALITSLVMNMATDCVGWVLVCKASSPLRWHFGAAMTQLELESVRPSFGASSMHQPGHLHAPRARVSLAKVLVFSRPHSLLQKTD